MKYVIKHRFSAAVLFTAEIMCNVEASESTKLRLAVCAADLCGASLSGADLRGANLHHATLNDAILRGADLRGADLRGAYLRGADLSDADLSDATLSGAYLRGADLSGADLRGADLRGAYLSGADLGGAYLRGAYLSGADLRGADLRGAYLSGADLGGAILCGANDKSLGKAVKIIAQMRCVYTGYSWLGIAMEDGSLRIWAGCRQGWTVTGFRRHVASYDDPRKAAEVTAMIDFFEAAYLREFPKGETK